MTRSTTLLRKDLLFRHIVHHAGSWQVMTVAAFALVTLQHRDAPRSDPGEERHVSNFQTLTYPWRSLDALET
jgi:hypothetical protein